MGILNRTLAIAGASSGTHRVGRRVVRRLAEGLRDRRVMLPMMAAAVDGDAAFVWCLGHGARIRCGDSADIVGYPSWWHTYAQCSPTQSPALREIDGAQGRRSDSSLPLPPPMRDVVQCCMLKGDHSQVLGGVPVAHDAAQRSSVTARADKRQRRPQSPGCAQPHHTHELPPLAAAGTRHRAQDENENIGDLRRAARQREKLVMMQE